MKTRTPAFFCALLTAVCFAGFARAEQPTTAQLLQGIPALSPENEELKSYAFSLESPMFFGTPFVLYTQWKRDEPMKLLTTFGENATPICYMAEGDAFFFDVLDRRALFIRNSYVKLVLFSDQKGFQFNYGFETNEKNAMLKVDVAGLLEQAVEEGEVSQLENGDWRIEFISKSGRTRFQIDFESNESYKLRQIETRSVEDDSLAFRIRNFSVNQPSGFTWPAFPETDALGDGVTIVEHTDDSKESPPEKLYTAMTFMVAQLGFAAVENADLRDQKFFHNIDWQAVQKCAAEFSPRLKRTLRVPLTDDLASEEPPTVR